MKQGMNKPTLTAKNGISGMLCAGLCLAGISYPLSGLAEAVQPPTVIVDSYAQHNGDRITYHYRVTNKSDLNINSITIGRDGRDDDDPANDIYELLERPSGWNLKYNIPSANSNAPTGWRVNMVPPEENAVAYGVVWEPLNDKSPKFLPRQSLSKFSITLDKADPNYLTGHALIGFESEVPTTMTVSFSPIDTTPPSITVNLSPNMLLSLNDKPIAVRASFTVRDDYDRMPLIRLESITPTDPQRTDEILDASLGLDDRYFKIRTDHRKETDRSYIVTYSATDASGNQSTASATVTVSAHRY